MCFPIPGVPEQERIGVRLEARLMELVQDGVAELIDLVQVDLAVNRQEAADLGKGGLPFPLPSLRLILRGKQTGQVSCQAEAHEGCQDQQPAQGRQQDSFFLAQFLHKGINRPDGPDRRSSAGRCW